MIEGNPYDWQARHREARPRISRTSLVQQIVRQLATNNVIVVGGYGTGKTWLLDELRAHLGEAVVYFSGPKGGGMPAAIRRLLRAVGPDGDVLDPIVASFVRGHERAHVLEDLSDRAVEALPVPEIVRKILDQSGVTRTVAIFDEADRYVDQHDRGSFARELFNNLNLWTRELQSGLRVVAAGGVGMYGLKAYLGSAFIDNAKWSKLAPFTFEEVREIAEPFSTAGRPLSEQALQQVMISTGGHAALTVYGLQLAWACDPPVTPFDVARIFGDFVRESPDYVHNYWEKLHDVRWRDASTALLGKLQGERPPYAVAALRLAIDAQSDPTKLRLDQMLDVLLATGVIRETATPGLVGDVLHVEVVPSVLLPALEPPKARGPSPLLAEVTRALDWMHRFAPAYFHGEKADRKLVPEANLAASVAIQLGARGLRVDLESVRGPGRTDILVTLPSDGGDTHAVVETKIWGRKHALIHEQTRAYMTSDVVAGVAVMFTEREIADWPREYAAQCLEGHCLAYERVDSPGAPLVAHFVARDTLPGGREVAVDHLLLHLQRPPRTSEGDG